MQLADELFDRFDKGLCWAQQCFLRADAQRPNGGVEMRNFLAERLRVPKVQRQGRVAAKICAMLAAAFAVSLSPAAGRAATLISTGSYEITGYYAAAELHYANCFGSTNRCQADISNPDLTSNLIEFTIPGVVTPNGATITSAVLTFDLSYLSQTGLALLRDLDAVDTYQFASPPFTHIIWKAGSLRLGSGER